MKIALEPEEIFRYGRGIAPIGISGENITQGKDIPDCSCGAKRMFEFQAVPQLLHCQKADSLGRRVDWGTCPSAPVLRAAAWAPATHGDLEARGNRYILQTTFQRLKNSHYLFDLAIPLSGLHPKKLIIPDREVQRCFRHCLQYLNIGETKCPVIWNYINVGVSIKQKAMQFSWYRTMCTFIRCRSK